MSSAQVSDATPSGDDVKQAGKQAVGLVQENPLGLAIGAVAVGFLAGMLIPSTKIEDVDFQVLFVPGHCPGSLCFLEKESRILFGGDVLFAGSVGRSGRQLILRLSAGYALFAEFIAAQQQIRGLARPPG